MSKLHALSWLLFAGTATIAAFLFPALLIYIHMSQIWDVNINNVINNITNNLLFKIIFFVIIGSVIYHGFYRFKAILQEQAPKYENYIEYTMLALAILFVIFALIITILI